MLNTTMLKRFLTSFLVILASQLIIQNSYASASFPTAAMQVGVTGITCRTCHTTIAGGSNAIKADACTIAFRSNRDYKALQTCVTPATPVAKGCALPLVSNGTKCVAAPKLGKGVTTVGNTTGKADSDSYTINCGAGTSYLSVAVQDLEPVLTPKVSVQIIKTTASGLSVDAKDGDAVYSPVAKLVKGAGVYKVIVNKTIATGPATNKKAELYNAVYACQNTKGVKTTNTPPVVGQNH
jgi:phosphoserine aminotransferase